MVYLQKIVLPSNVPEKVFELNKDYKYIVGFIALSSTKPSSVGVVEFKKNYSFFHTETIIDNLDSYFWSHFQKNEQKPWLPVLENNIGWIRFRCYRPGNNLSGDDEVFVVLSNEKISPAWRYKGQDYVFIKTGVVTKKIEIKEKIIKTGIWVNDYVNSITLRTSTNNIVENFNSRIINYALFWDFPEYSGNIKIFIDSKQDKLKIINLGFVYEHKLSEHIDSDIKPLRKPKI